MTKYYKTTLVVEVLSQEPLGDIGLHDLDAVLYWCTGGDCSGHVEQKTEEVDAETMRGLMLAHGSDPGFFGL